MPIENAYAEIFLFTPENESLRNTKTSTINFEPWQRTFILAYLDLRGLPLGVYPAHALISYSGKMSEKEFLLTIYEPKKTIWTLTTFLVAIIVLLVILLLLSFLRKHSSLTNQKKK